LKGKTTTEEGMEGNFAFLIGRGSVLMKNQKSTILTSQKARRRKQMGKKGKG